MEVTGWPGRGPEALWLQSESGNLEVGILEAAKWSEGVDAR